MEARSLSPALAPLQIRALGHVLGAGLRSRWQRLTGGYDVWVASSNSKAVPDPKPAQASGPPATPLKRGLPGTDDERTSQRKRFLAEHRETLRRLGK